MLTSVIGPCRFCGASLCEKDCSTLYDDPRVVARFWSHVDRSGACWIWTAARGKMGYGIFCGRGGEEAINAHRYAWILIHGAIPSGLELCHNCPSGDNPACVNPAHHFLGTHAANMADAASKGLMSRGQRRYNAKLTDDAVRVIRERYAGGGVTQSELAAHFGVSASVVSLVISRKVWRHVD